MDPDGEQDEEVYSWEGNTPPKNLEFDFFSQTPSKVTAAGSSSGGRGRLPRCGSVDAEGLNLNSQAVDLNDGMSYMDLLQSSSAGVITEEESGGAARANGRGAGGGRGTDNDRVTSAGRGTSGGRGASGGRGRGVGLGEVGRGAGGLREHDLAVLGGGGRGTGLGAVGRGAGGLGEHDVAVHGGGARGRGARGGRGAGCGAGRGATGRHPASSASRSSLPPRPAVRRSRSAGAAPVATNGGVRTGDQELDPSVWSQQPYEEEADDFLGEDASVLLPRTIFSQE